MHLAPLVAAFASVAVAVGGLLLVTTRVVTERAGLAAAVICLLGVGLAVTYAGRMVRMLAAQQREGRRELA